jgi:polysaccharide export outer membrane protein
MRRTLVLTSLVVVLWFPMPVDAAEQSGGPAPGEAVVDIPADYVIGPGDVLSIVFWRDNEMSQEVVVRPDGKISMPLLNDVDAAGRTPEQLRGRLSAAASELIEGPNVAVVVKAINSRFVYITGKVAKPGPYPIQGSLNVLQLIATAGGVAEYANSKNIVIMRSEGGQTKSFKFNYKDVIRQLRVEQNILLKPGDTVVVP